MFAGGHFGDQNDAPASSVVEVQGSPSANLSTSEDNNE
jgi:hypothetical protein